MPGLAELVARELRRREEGDGKFPVLRLAVDDTVDATTNVAEATKAIIADAATRQQQVAVTPASPTPS
jgi:hypothetical protein